MNRSSSTEVLKEVKKKIRWRRRRRRRKRWWRWRWWWRRRRRCRRRRRLAVEKAGGGGGWRWRRLAVEVLCGCDVVLEVLEGKNRVVTMLKMCHNVSGYDCLHAAAAGVLGAHEQKLLN